MMLLIQSLVLVFAATVLQAQTVPTAPAPLPPQSSTESGATTVDEVEGPNSSSNSQGQATSNAPAGDDFKPSEEISEDYPVPLPSDI